MLSGGCQVKDAVRVRSIHARQGIRARLAIAWDDCQGWIAVIVIGLLSAFVAFLVDVAEATVSDWKLGYCTSNPFYNREQCCTDRTPLFTSKTKVNVGEDCRDWHMWTNDFWPGFGIYTGWALLFGIIAASVTMLTKTSFPAAASGHGNNGGLKGDARGVKGKTIYLAAGSGIPEIKTILSGFVIPHILDLKVLIVKAVGAVFAVATAMCLGKEGPFVHTSTCAAYLVGSWFPKYRENGRKLRELLSAGCAAGLSVAFGAPIGGVLFSYEVWKGKARCLSPN